MRGFLIVLLIGALMVFAGWLTFQNYGDHSSVTLETGKIRQDTNQAVHKGAEAFDNAAEKVKDKTSEIRRQTSDAPVRGND